MGLTPVWKLRETAQAGAAQAAQTAIEVDSAHARTSLGRTADARGPIPASGSREERIARMQWPELKAAVKDCTACGLRAGCTQTVFGVGDEQARWLLVGEAPGAEEDRLGEPFVGQAGKLLDNMLAAIGLARGKDVYIANVLKCRPPGNRNPEPDEVAKCSPFLVRQVELIRPKLILAMGRFAVQTLLNTDATIGSLRGTVHQYHGVPLIVTYHPAYLLRNLPDKAKAWADLLFAKSTIAGN
jgi:DNA polymerase